MPYYIYVFQNQINLKTFVERTTNPEIRSREIKSCMERMEFDRFKMTLLEEFSDENEAIEAENFWIDFFNSRNRELGYNLELSSSKDKLDLLKKSRTLYSLYLIFNVITDKIYVGISQNPQKRWKRHKSDALNEKKKKYPIQRALKKYGDEYFIFKVVGEFDSWTKACEAEKQWIAEFRINNWKLYNITDGGEGTQGVKYTEERKKIMSKMNSGAGNPMYGVQLFGEANGNFGKEMKLHVKETLLTYRRKLTDKQIKEVRSLYAAGDYTQSKLSEMFNISLTQIHRIVRNKGWTDNPNRTAITKPNLVAAQVIEMRALYASGNYLQKELAEKYGISLTQIGRIINRERWKDI
jgi:group I intron endonuclease